jgi:general secretion pathway protein N
VRAEDVAPRTWLLATLAGWALLAWLLTLAGLGGRVSPLDEDASLRQPLPQPRPSPPERLGALAQYGEISTRPLFSEDRRPKPFSLRAQGDEEPTNTFDYVLTSVLLTPRVKLAILQPTAEAQAQGQGEGGPQSIRIKLGESAEQAAGWRLVALEPRQAVFEGPEGQRTLELRAFDGSGGVSATPPSTPVAGNTRPRPNVVRDANAAAQAAEAAANAADAATPEGAAARAAARGRPAPVPKPESEPELSTPDAQIEAIRQRIQARREQLRREAQQPPPAQ